MPPPTARPWKRPILKAIAHGANALRGHRRPSLEELQSIRNFLVLQYEKPLGSVVHATPFFQALRQSAPDASIVVAASAMAASVLGKNPAIDRCEVTPDPWNGFPRAMRSIRRLLTAMPTGPLCIVTLIGNQRTRVAMLSLLAADATRAGYTLAPELYDVPLNFQPERGQIEGNLDILRALGHRVNFCEPRIFFGQEDADYAADLLAALPGGVARPRIVYGTQNSGGQPNQWSAERFQQVIEALSEQTGADPIFVGTGKEAANIEQLRQPLRNSGISLAGRTTIPQLAAVFAQADLAISLDTGTFHVARAVGLPGVVIAPAWQSPLEWLPVDHPRYRVLRGPSIEKPGDGYWIAEVQVEQVIAAALPLLRESLESRTARGTRIDGALATPHNPRSASRTTI
jgi:ADP-heptose:LPS heptosyltransferase